MKRTIRSITCEKKFSLSELLFLGMTSVVIIEHGILMGIGVYILFMVVQFVLEAFYD